MQARDFCYWLQGYIELASTDGTPVMSKEKLECVKKHLNMVFVHDIDPTHGDSETQKELNKLHSGSGKQPLMRC